MKHIQKFADSLLGMISDGGSIHTLWMNSGDTRSLQSTAKEWKLSQDGWTSAWNALKQLGFAVAVPRPASVHLLPATRRLTATARITDQKTQNRYVFRVDMFVSTRSSNNLEIRIDRVDSNLDLETLYQGMKTFKVDELKSNPNLAEDFLRKFLEDFDAKGFALGSHNKVTSSRQFSPKFLKDLVSEIHHNAQKKFSSSDLEDMSDRNLPTQLDYLLSAYEPQHDASADFAKVYTAEIADFFKMSGHEQAKALSGVFKGL